jgi:transposase, IS5 family
MSKLRGLFDEQIRLEKLSKLQDPLERLSTHIDFEFFRAPLESALLQDTDKSKGGRPPYDVVLMFKILILQRYYSVSDDGIEYAILDRLSFMRFLGLGLNDRVPDAKTIWLFRDTLTKLNLIEQLFKYLDKQLDKDGVIVHKGKIVDASISQVPVQRNSRDENNQLKQGNIPQDWSTHKLRQKDVDAKWTQKNNKQYFGYKNHIKADSKTKLITNYKVTSANISDKHVVESLLDKKSDGGQPFYGDAAYNDKTLSGVYNRMGVINKTNRQGYRNKKLTQKEHMDNRKKSKVRARVEHIFGFMANSMGGTFLKYRSFIRNEAALGLRNITYNLFRLVQLNIGLIK